MDIKIKENHLTISKLKHLANLFPLQTNITLKRSSKCHIHIAIAHQPQPHKNFV